MKLHSASKSSLFLLELLFSILFFILAASLCIQIFVRARLLSRDAEGLTFSHNLCENAASIICGTAGEEEDVTGALLAFFPEAVRSDDGLTLYYDSGWNPSGEENAVYTAVITLAEEGSTRSGLILVSRTDGTEIYRLPVSCHVPRRLAGLFRGEVCA